MRKVMTSLWVYTMLSLLMRLAIVSHRSQGKQHGEDIWTPVELQNPARNPQVVLCRLKFDEYSKHPHELPMFKDLVDASHCSGSNRRTAFVSDLINDIDQHPERPGNRIVHPSGFVFHESRVGSTLVANLFATNPQALVICQANPMSQALTRCTGCTFEYKVKLFRDITTLMGRSMQHEYLFFKFQSFVVTQMEVALEAFPKVPWVFIFRNPVQTVTSHLSPVKNSDPKRNERPPCLRSKNHPSDAVIKTLSKVTSHPTHAPDEAWCAAHLNMLCSTALRMYDKYSHYLTNDGKIRRGLLVNYESLPGYVPQVILPFFNVNPVPTEWWQKMKLESDFYSKGRSAATSSRFSGDSKVKELAATRNIQQYADKILGASYKRLNRKAIEGLKDVFPPLYQHLLQVKQRQRLPSAATGSSVESNHEDYVAWHVVKELKVDTIETSANAPSH